MESVGTNRVPTERALKELGFDSDVWVASFSTRECANCWKIGLEGEISSCIMCLDGII